VKKLIIALLLTGSAVLQAAQYSEAEINALMSKSEGDLVAWLQQEGKSHTEITKYYLNAAEQTHMLHQYSVAKVLYKKALQRKDLQDKMLAYLPLLSMNVQAENWPEASRLYQEAEAYLKANPKLLTKDTQERLTIFKMQIAKKPSSQQERESVEFPHNTQMVFWHDLKQYLVNKNYEQAFKMIEGQDYSGKDINLQILADIIYTGAKKPRPSLYCKKDYDLYSDSHESSYSMKLCGVLLGIQAGKKISEKEFSELKNLIKLRYPENLYLEQVARDLATRK